MVSGASLLCPLQRFTAFLSFVGGVWWPISIYIYMYVHSLTISVSQMTSSRATSLGNFSFRFHLPYIAPLPFFLLRPSAFRTSLPAYLDWDGRPVVCCLSFWVFFSGWNLMSSSSPLLVPPRSASSPPFAPTTYVLGCYCSSLACLTCFLSLTHVALFLYLLSLFFCWCGCCASWCSTMRLPHYAYEGLCISCCAPSRGLCLPSCGFFTPLSRARLPFRAERRGQACRRTNSNAPGLPRYLLRGPPHHHLHSHRCAVPLLHSALSHGAKSNRVRLHWKDRADSGFSAFVAASPHFAPHRRMACGHLQCVVSQAPVPLRQLCVSGSQAAHLIPCQC